MRTYPYLGYLAIVRRRPGDNLHGGWQTHTAPTNPPVLDKGFIPSYRDTVLSTLLLGKKMNFVKAAAIILVTLWGVAGGVRHHWFGLLNEANLFIHEIGHPLFSVTNSETMTALGGTILQLLVPAGATVYFFLSGQRYSAAYSIFWLASNFFDVAIYIGDARAQVLDLVTLGNPEDATHDWAFLLGQWHLLRYDVAISGVVASIGWLGLVAALLVGLWYALEGPVFDENTAPIPELADGLPAPPVPPDDAPPARREIDPDSVTDFFKGPRPNG